MTALQALLAGIVDYAGLFPPAAVDMDAAVRNYGSYRAEEQAWMLGRFVVPAARLEELADARARVGAVDDPEWRLSALLGSDAPRDLQLIAAFNARNTGRARVDSVEGRLTTTEAIQAVGELRDRAIDCFVEVPIEPDPAPLVDTIRDAAMNAKVRTGGLTPDAIPPAAQVVRFMRRCIERGVRFKATAGLHHPLRADFPLTYAPDAPIGTMYGYLNVFLAAAFMANGLSDADATSLLEEQDRAAIVVTPEAIEWRGHTATTDALRLTRDAVASSFGSCSFREPVDELRTLILV